MKIMPEIDALSYPYTFLTEPENEPQYILKDEFVQLEYENCFFFSAL